MMKAKTKSQQQLEALQALYSKLDTIDDEPLDEEFDEILAQGIRLREVDL